MLLVKDLQGSRISGKGSGLEATWADAFCFQSAKLYKYTISCLFYLGYRYRKCVYKGFFKYLVDVNVSKILETN